MEGRGSYIVRRLMWVPLILLVVSSVTFTLARLGPGDPIRVAAGQFRDPEAFERIRAARGLDKPIYEQYYIYMKGVVTRGDLGESYRYRDYDVNEIIFPAMWRSMQFNTVALTATLGIGIPLGIFAAKRQGTWSDPTSISFFLFLQSFSTLVIVPILLWVFALKLGILPARGWPQECPVALDFLGNSYRCLGVVSREAVIPLMAMILPAIASWGRYTRAFTLDVLKEDYVRTARSKGIHEVTVLTRHVLRNAMLPLSTIIGFALVGLLEGSFFVENLTGIPGIGRLAFEAVGTRDYDMIMAIVLVGATTFVLATIAIDMAYTVIDPRIRYGRRN